MKPAAPSRGAWRRLQHGAAAIELAMVISATLVLLPALALFAQVFYKYSVIKGATQNGAAYLATLPPASIKDDIERARAFALVQRMVDEAAAGASLAGSTRVFPATILCNGNTCTGMVPRVFIVKVSLTIEDLAFSGLTSAWTDSGSKKWEVNAESSIPYVNN